MLVVALDSVENLREWHHRIVHNGLTREFNTRYLKRQAGWLDKRG